jgi:isoleucyl-tRNA synthetase
MDRWIIAANQNTIKFSRAEIEKYKLYTVAPHILSFLENLTNWYVKLNRPRMKGDEGVSAEDQYTCLNTLFDVLLSTCQLMAPFTPFLSEYFFQNLKNGFDPASPLNQDSIHFTPMPNFDETLINEAIENSVSKM